ncbi:hypothetical protein [Raoultibacter phocaeensis]|uniref:hypothetical protein n=1 Tax=Raoultibacter phocaeensis TaxID=2479841 RepID=UPI0011181A4B|nr:hypothetical protein [Raoultibacter phocaeensis]
METTSFTDAKAVALAVLRAPELIGTVFLEGGLVPWIISGNDSGRCHDDVDFSVRAADMPAVRSWLAMRGFYDETLDSLNLECNSSRADFGVHAVVDSVMVSFAPFSIENGALEQRNALHASFAGYDALLLATAAGLEEDDFVEMRELPDGSRVGMSTIEAVRAAKVATDREKDLADLAELDRIGYDADRFARVAAAFATMEVTCPAHSE